MMAHIGGVMGIQDLFPAIYQISRIHYLPPHNNILNNKYNQII